MNAVDTAIKNHQDYLTECLDIETIISVHHDVREMEEWEQVDVLTTAIITSPDYSLDKEHKLCQEIEHACWNYSA